jgi:hypothetical protein
LYTIFITNPIKKINPKTIVSRIEISCKTSNSLPFTKAVVNANIKREISEGYIICKDVSIIFFIKTSLNHS